MRPTFARFAQKQYSIFRFPPELTPLYAACVVVCCSATFFTYKKLTTDQTIRIGRENPKFEEKLVEAIKKDE